VIALSGVKSLKEAHMTAVIKPGWSKPCTILFASESPPNEKAFAFALAEAAEFSADLIILHAYDGPNVAAPEAPGDLRL